MRGSVRMVAPHLMEFVLVLTAIMVISVHNVRMPITSTLSVLSSDLTLSANTTQSTVF